MSEKIISVENVSFNYKSDLQDRHRATLDNLSFSVNQGDFVAVIGRNGSGKSTLARLLTGILTPEKGKIFVDGKDTSDPDKLFDIRKACSMVFQNPDNQIVTTVVEEDVAFALENMGVPSFEIRSRVDKALAAVGMSQYAKAAPHLLSGGQKQRIAIAGVLAMRPKCIVMDEPTAMLDPQGRDDVMHTIKNLNFAGITVVLITHHMNEACQAKRVIVLNDGQLKADGTPKEIFSQVSELYEAGLSVPQTVQLLYELRNSGMDVNIGAFSPEDCAREIRRVLNSK